MAKIDSIKLSEIDPETQFSGGDINVARAFETSSGSNIHNKKMFIVPAVDLGGAGKQSLLVPDITNKKVHLLSDFMNLYDKQNARTDYGDLTDEITEAQVEFMEFFKMIGFDLSKIYDDPTKVKHITDGLFTNYNVPTSKMATVTNGKSTRKVNLTDGEQENISSFNQGYQQRNYWSLRGKKYTFEQLTNLAETYKKIYDDLVQNGWPPSIPSQHKPKSYIKPDILPQYADIAAQFSQGK